MDPLLLFVSSYFTLLSNKAHPWKEERSEHSLRKSQKCAFAKANSIYQTSNFLFQAWFHGFAPPAKSSRTSNIVMSTHGKLWIPCWQCKVYWWTSGNVNSTWTQRNSVVLRNSLWFTVLATHFFPQHPGSTNTPFWKDAFAHHVLGVLGPLIDPTTEKSWSSLLKIFPRRNSSFRVKGIYPKKMAQNWKTYENLLWIPKDSWFFSNGGHRAPTHLHFVQPHLIDATFLNLFVVPILKNPIGLL